ncbi:MAG: hypothetical protein OXN21_08800 [Chloroflexota bacterium]|nr:hypothetical protein [Chloroflexota bacterium]
MNQRLTTDRITLTLSVEGNRMPLTFFIRTTEDLQKLLRAIEEAQLGEASHAQWEIDADRIQIAASVNGVSMDDLESIVNDAYQSLKATDAQDDAGIPRTVDDQGKRLTRTIINRAKRTVPVTVEALGQEPIYIDAGPVQQGRPPSSHQVSQGLNAWGSVDGELDVISVRRRPYFVIYEHASRNRIRCLFPDDWMDKVKNLLGYRVIVEGNLHYRSNGSVSALAQPTAINAVSSPVRSIAEFRGALPGISGELSSAEYVRQLRTREHSG